MIRFKSGVSLKNLQPQAAVLLPILDGCYGALELDCVVTAGSDGEHMAQSLHADGFALDFRTKHVPRARLDEFLDHVRDALNGTEYDWVIEKRDAAGEHLHVEWDPKP